MQAGHLLVQVDRVGAFELIVEKLFNAAPIRNKGFAPAYRIGCICTEAQCGGLIDQPSSGGWLNANTTAPLDDQPAGAMKGEVTKLERQPAMKVTYGNLFPLDPPLPNQLTPFRHFSINERRRLTRRHRARIKAAVEQSRRNVGLFVNRQEILL